MLHQCTTRHLHVDTVAAVSNLRYKSLTVRPMHEKKRGRREQGIKHRRLTIKNSISTYRKLSHAHMSMILIVHICIIESIIQFVSHGNEFWDSCLLTAAILNCDVRSRKIFHKNSCKNENKLFNIVGALK